MELIEIIVDENIRLKSWQPAMAPDLFSLVNKNRDYLLPWLPWVPGVREIKDSENFISSAIKEMEGKSGFELGIWYQDRLIGCIGLHEISPENKRAEIGYWMDQDFQGQGIMTKSVNALINYSFTRLNLNRLSLMAATTNPASYSVAERLGFTKEGIARRYEYINGRFLDYYQYSLLKSDTN